MNHAQSGFFVLDAYNYNFCVFEKFEKCSKSPKPSITFC